MMNMHIYKYLSLKDWRRIGWKERQNREVLFASRITCHEYESTLPLHIFRISVFLFLSHFKKKKFLLCLLWQSLVKLNICNFYRVSWLIFLFATCPTFIKQIDYLFSYVELLLLSFFLFILPLNTVLCDLCLNYSIWQRKRQFTSILISFNSI